MVICLERGADLHMAQLMPLPLTVSCSSKIQIGFTFLVPAHLGSPGQKAVKRACVCVCIVRRYIYCVGVLLMTHISDLSSKSYCVSLSSVANEATSVLSTRPHTSCTADAIRSLQSPDARFNMLSVDSDQQQMAAPACFS